MIRIFGNSWNIELTDDKEKLMVDNKFCKGSIHYNDACIYIYRNLSLRHIKRVLLHELTHAVIYETQSFYKESYSEEDMCEFISRYSLYINKIFRKAIKELIK